jgi:autotransporter passenger strand-loop-strand repeat protein
VVSGGTTIDTTINGGTVDLQSGASVGSASNSAAITFNTTGGGTLILEASQSFSGTVAGITTSTGVLQLNDVTFSASTTSAFIESGTLTSSSATLEVTNGNQSAFIGLVGNYSGSNWTTSAAPGGGTVVVDPANAGGAATSTTINSGGGPAVAGTASDTTASSGGYQTVVSGGAEPLSGASVGSASNSAVFTGGGTPTLDPSMSFGGTVAGITTSTDVLDLSIQSGTSTSATPAVTNGAQTVDTALLGNYINTAWTTSPDGLGGTLVPATPIPTTQSAGIALHG